MTERCLLGKIALVTGGATGIGAGIALALAQAGASVAFTYLDGAPDERPDEVLAQILAADAEGLALPVDFRFPWPTVRPVLATVEHFGRLDLLVNNAGVTLAKPFVDLDYETLDDTLSINLRGPILCSQAAARAMIAQRSGGRIINLASVHAFAGATRHAHYAATKGALVAFTRALAVELATHQITVNAIAPGMIPVPRYYRDTPEFDPQIAAQGIPLGRPGTPQDIANLAVFLASDAASYLTGQTITVDGGMLSRFP